jgi:hypothetical protein
VATSRARRTSFCAGAEAAAETPGPIGGGAAPPGRAREVTCGHVRGGLGAAGRFWAKVTCEWGGSTAGPGRSVPCGGDDDERSSPRPPFTSRVLHEAQSPPGPSNHRLRREPCARYRRPAPLLARRQAVSYLTGPIRLAFGCNPSSKLGRHTKLVLGPRRPLSPTAGALACHNDPVRAERVRKLRNPGRTSLPSSR